MKPSDKKAEAITFGVELETTIPVLSGVVVGNYHNGISTNVNASCGCHIIVGVASIIGTEDLQAMSDFARKLAHITRWHAMSLYDLG